MDESLSSSSANLVEYLTVCTCGRGFAQLNAYGNHQRTCKKRKKHLSNALVKAKELWTARKRPRRENEGDELTGFTTPAFGHQAGAQILAAEKSGLQGAHEFANLEFCPEQAPTNKVECSANSGSGSNPSWAIIHTEDNVSLTVDSDDISCY